MRPSIRAFVVLALACVPARTQERPNVLVITTDDQDDRSFELRTPDGRFVMHNVRELIAREGVVFRRAFAPNPLCCPSRAALLTGQYNHNNGVLLNVPPLGGYAAFDTSNALQLWLQDADYFTLHVGKYLNGYGENAGPGPDLSVPPGWNRWFTRLIASYSDSYFNFKVSEDGVLKSFGSSPSEYQTDVMTRKVREYLVTRPYGARPFFMLVDYGAPHGESAPPFLPVPAPRHAGRMNGAQLPMPPSFNEADVSDKPQGIASLPLLSPAQIATIELRHRLRMESLLAVDEGVALIVETLAATGQLDDTLIVFTSDNGYQSGEHRIFNGKGQPYESARVPLVMRGPGIPRGIAVKRLVANIDVTATILDVARATAGLPQDGRSLTPLFANPAAPWRSMLLLENPAGEFFRGLRTQDAVTGREHLYVEYDYDQDGAADERELYSVLADECSSLNDTYLLENRASDPCHAVRVEQFAAALEAWRDCSGGACP